MRNDDDKMKSLIDGLTDALEPVAPLLSPEKRAFLWFFLHTLGIGIIMHFIRPFNGGILHDLLMIRFSGEVLAFFVFSFLAGYAAFLSVVPGTKSRQAFMVAFVCFGVFALLIGISFFAPAKEVSPAGYRPQCIFEIMALSLLPIFHMFYLLRKGLFENRIKTLIVAFVAASLIPSGLMHFACMYDPVHVVKFHVGPSIAMALIVFAVVMLIYKKTSK